MCACVPTYCPPVGYVAYVAHKSYYSASPLPRLWAVAGGAFAVYRAFGERMAKKKRTAKRSTKARRRRRTVGAGASTTAATANAVGKSTAKGVSAPEPNAALQSTRGVTEPPPAAVAAPQGGEAQFGGVGNTGIDTIQFAAPISPTFYTESPQGTVIVQNHVTINIQGVEFNEFDKDMKALIDELRRSNEISGEVRDQLLSELRAGSEIITGPKPQRGLIDLLLVRPLKWLAEKSGSAIIQKLALDALQLLLKML